MTEMTQLLILLGIALVMNLTGFRYFVHFLNVGYAFSIAGMSVAAWLMFRLELDGLELLHLAALLIWGLRLGIFVLGRQRKPNYKKELEAIQQRYGRVGLGSRFAIWPVVSVLYVLMFLPAYFHAGQVHFFPPAASNIIEVTGLSLLYGGLALEILSDSQKSAFKKKNPDRFCDTGIYQMVRFPSYLGEMLVWIGSWIAGAAFYHTLWHWLASLAGLIMILLIMVGSARRLELTQDERYGDLPEYQEYVKSVPVLFPVLPLYSLRKARLYLG